MTTRDQNLDGSDSTSSPLSERPVGGWYVALRRDPLPREADRLFPTVGADTPQGLREILTRQAGS